MDWPKGPVIAFFLGKDIRVRIFRLGSGGLGALGNPFPKHGNLLLGQFAFFLGHLALLNL